MTLTPQFLRTLVAVARHPTASREELKAFQDAQLRRLLVHAYENVPFYRKLFDRHRLHPKHIRGTVDLDLIPTISKQDMRERPWSDLLSRGIDPARLLEVRTNGSTGEPFVVRRTKLESTFRSLFRYRSLQEFGLRVTDRVAVIGMPRPTDPKNPKLPGRMLRAIGINPSVRIDGMQDPTAVVGQIDEFRPDVIIGLPGMLCQVADHLGTLGRDNIRPRILSVGGEVLTPLMRRRLTEAFGIEPIQAYASHEFPLMGWECRVTGGIHTCDDGVIFEVLRDGRPALPGEDGEVVVTNLHAYAMPFVRYKLADIVTRGAEQCPCGQPFSVIKAIRGRMIDAFPLPNGRLVDPYHILDSLMPGTDDIWIRQYQLVHDTPDRIVLRVVPSQREVPELRDRITRAVIPVLGPGIEFQVRIVEEIPLDSGGKFRHCRSLVASAYDQVASGPCGK